MFCTAGGVSNYLTVMARTEPKGPISKSVTQFVIDTRKPGWSIARVNDMMGNELVSNVQMHFENFRVPDRYRVSPVNGAFDSHEIPSRRQVPPYVCRPRLGGKYLGRHEGIRTGRIQGGKPIIQHNNVGMLIAETDCMIRTAGFSSIRTPGNGRMSARAR